jgi:CubicO group peptidase (beta-lactamase class C family)
VTPDIAFKRWIPFSVALLLASPCIAHAELRNPVPESSIDALFSTWTTSTPGCAVGVSEGGKIVLERAYGMADLEHGVPNAPDTIFEAGSVSKQFTATAVLLLERDGKLSLDDPIRKYVPELPDYGTPITIRQMLQHTSGLRDWGSVEDIAGWPRGSRVYTHAHVLDILSRQSRLNFTPGTRWSYSNSGYNLAAILVSRVSGEPFAEFTRKRIFEPLGMTRTSWRDDFTRIVKGRAVAYAESGGVYRSDMPFENIHGNGGLLTTVGDLLRWNGNFVESKVGDAKFIRAMQVPGRLPDGGEYDYAYGLGIGVYNGIAEIRHSGTTAGYRAFLARYPDAHVSVALLCNTGSSTPRQTLHAVADLYLAGLLKPEPAQAPVTVAEAELDALVGLYRNAERGDVMRIERDGNSLRLGDGTALLARSSKRFTDGDGFVIEFDGAGGGSLDEGNGTITRVERFAAAKPTATELEALAGSYTSDDAETSITARVRDGSLELTRRPDSVFRLTPLYADAFDSELGTIIFRRDGAGHPVAFSVVRDRVWDLRFER